MKKNIEVKELNSKDDKALYKELITLNHDLTKLRLSASFRKLKNYHEITRARKKIARIWTILNFRIIEKIEKETK